MKGVWLHKKKCRDLIIFCNGWGMDELPFRPIAANNYDVYMLYDYAHLNFDIFETRIVEKYDHLVLIGWSMGVWAGQKLFSGKTELFERTIAINGTLCPISDSFGIPVELFDGTLLGFGECTRSKFYRRMCREKKNLETFLSNQPGRTLENQHIELAALRENVDCFTARESMYNEIIIGENDWIVPSANQLRFWQGCRTITIPGFHFLFYLWQSWDQLLMFSESSSLE